MRLPPAPYLRSIRVRNFKAIRDSGLVKLTPLTVFIGNNGVGKSSLIEALETLQIAAFEGVDQAMNRWKGIENVVNKYAPPKPDSTAPIRIYAQGRLVLRAVVRPGPTFGDGQFMAARGEVAIAADRNLSRVRILAEWYTERGHSKISARHLRAGTHALLGSNDAFGPSISRWQFLQMEPTAMGAPQPPAASSYGILLTKDASNIASYLKSFYDADTPAFEDLIRVMGYVVPYAKSFNVEQTGEPIRTNYLTLAESSFKIPGWMISTGTLRVLAILACLRHPYPPVLLVIEELENGLDPRTLGFVLGEIADATASGRTQVIITTHSPSLLDQVPLESIVTVQREDGQPTFRRPADDDGLAEWKNRFLPGQLYAMGRFRRRP